MNEDILFYAFRYALGRMTYAVSTVGEEIIHQKGLGNLSPKCCNLMMEEIAQAKKEKRLGMKCDADVWEKVYKTLKQK